MSVLNYFFKSKKKMANKNTSHIRIGKYIISSHAQNRIVDPKRNLKKKDLIINLFGKSKNSKPYLHIDGKTNQYDRINYHNRTITHITINKNMVKSIRKFHKNKRLQISVIGKR